MPHTLGVKTMLCACTALASLVSWGLNFCWCSCAHSLCLLCCREQTLDGVRIAREQQARHVSVNHRSGTVRLLSTCSVCMYMCTWCRVCSCILSSIDSSYPPCRLPVTTTCIHVQLVHLYPVFLLLLFQRKKIIIVCNALKCTTYRSDQ